MERRRREVKKNGAHLSKVDKFAYLQRVSDFFVREAFRYLFEHFDFTACQFFENVSFGKPRRDFSWNPAVTLGDGRHLIVYNHATRARSPLNVALSRDGRTWAAAAVVESEPGEYSYPAVIQRANGLIDITYTWRRQRIKHVVIDPAKLRTVPMRDGRWPEPAFAGPEANASWPPLPIRPHVHPSSQD